MRISCANFRLASSTLSASEGIHDSLGLRGAHGILLQGQEHAAAVPERGLDEPVVARYSGHSESSSGTHRRAAGAKQGGADQTEAMTGPMPGIRNVMAAPSGNPTAAPVTPPSHRPWPRPSRGLALVGGH